VNDTSLGTALRELREASGKQAQTVARGALMSPSKLSKIERNTLVPSTNDVERILSVLDVPDEVRTGLIQEARRAATEATAWRIYRRSGLHKHQDEIRAIEAQTTLMRLFQSSAVPGLLQTPEYIRGILRSRRLSDEELERTLGARLRRQEVLYDSAKTFCFIITESVLRWRFIPSPMMAAQLDRIASASRMVNVELGILPQSADLDLLPGTSFVLFDARLASVEVPHAEVTTRDTRDIEIYAERFERFRAAALIGSEMMPLVESIRDNYLAEV
jgi:transcriptional regulator with XRE-family HTH domain